VSGGLIDSQIWSMARLMVRGRVCQLWWARASLAPWLVVLTSLVKSGFSVVMYSGGGPEIVVGGGRGWLDGRKRGGVGMLSESMDGGCWLELVVEGITVEDDSPGPRGAPYRGGLPLPLEAPMCVSVGTSLWKSCSTVSRDDISVFTVWSGCCVVVVGGRPRPRPFECMMCARMQRTETCDTVCTPSNVFSLQTRISRMRVTIVTTIAQNSHSFKLATAERDIRRKYRTVQSHNVST